MSYEATWRSIVDSPDAKVAIRQHLAFLAESDECERLLDALVALFVSVRISGGRLEVVLRYPDFDHDCVVKFAAPYDGPAEGVPASVVKVVRIHNGIVAESFGGGWFGFWGFADGAFVGSGGWEYEALEEAEDDNAVFLDRLREAGLGPEDVQSPCEYGQNWLIWNPVEKNALGEPTVYFVSHGDCVATPVAGARDVAFGPLVLRVLAQGIADEEVFEEVYS
jgi:hypothetical protein